MRNTKLKRLLMPFLLCVIPCLSNAEELETKELDLPLVLKEADQIPQESAELVLTTIVVNLNDFLDLFFPRVREEEVTCLAENIYYEAGSEPLEGKIAVGIVTINRLIDKRFPNSICEVVAQKRTFKTKSTVRTVCQFSWKCARVSKPTANDIRWMNSYEVAKKLLTSDSYANFSKIYSGAMWFHATSVNPSWAKKKQRIKRVGGHIFYSE